MALRSNSSREPLQRFEVILAARIAPLIAFRDFILHLVVKTVARTYSQDESGQSIRSLPLPDPSGLRYRGSTHGTLAPCRPLFQSEAA